MSRNRIATQFIAFEVDIPLQALRRSADIKPLCAVTSVDNELALLVADSQHGKAAALRRLIAEYEATLLGTEHLPDERHAADKEPSS